MKSKTIYDFVLWAIPRFHRAGAEQKQQPHIAYFLNARFGQTSNNPTPAKTVRAIALSAESSEQTTLPHTRH
jgi:hypothetical protein